VANTKLSVEQVRAMCKAQGLNDDQTAGMLKDMYGTGGLKKANGQVVDYTTKVGRRGLYLEVKSMKIFLQVEQAEKYIAEMEAARVTLVELLRRAKAGEIDDTRKAAGQDNSR
jgi:hypothetical protein